MNFVNILDLVFHPDIGVGTSFVGFTNSLNVAMLAWLATRVYQSVYRNARIHFAIPSLNLQRSAPIMLILQEI
jgi:hypothetical protein